ncbi:hypothetical protein [Micromonospora sp. RTP1Z1]|nr:hypothetical protein [Micromonospora sp. RTP1Z1]
MGTLRLWRSNENLTAIASAFGRSYHAYPATQDNRSPVAPAIPS